MFYFSKEEGRCTYTISDIGFQSRWLFMTKLMHVKFTGLHLCKLWIILKITGFFSILHIFMFIDKPNIRTVVWLARLFYCRIVYMIGWSNMDEWLPWQVPLVEQVLIPFRNNWVHPRFCGVLVARSLDFCVVICRTLLSFCPISYGYCVVCPSSIYGFIVLLVYLQTLLTWHDFSLKTKWYYKIVFINTRSQGIWETQQDTIVRVDNHMTKLISNEWISFQENNWLCDK